MSPYSYLFLFSELLALITGTYFLQKIKNRFLCLYIYVAIGFATDALQAVLIINDLKNTLWLSHIYFPLEFVILTLFYIPYLAPVLKREWIFLIMSVYMIFAVVNPLCMQSLKEYSQMRIYSSIILVVFSLIYFYKLMNELDKSKLSVEPMVWVNASVLILCSVIFFYNILFNKLLEYSREAISIVSDIMGCFISLFYITIAISFWKAGNQKVEATKG